MIQCSERVVAVAAVRSKLSASVPVASVAYERVEAEPVAVSVTTNAERVALQVTVKPGVVNAAVMIVAAFVKDEALERSILDEVMTTPLLVIVNSPAESA